jgi:hypothetical protein
MVARYFYIEFHPKCEVANFQLAGKNLAVVKMIK